MKKDPLSSAGNGNMFEGPARTASYEAKAGEKTPRSSCQTIQRVQRAEGRAPRSSTQTIMCFQTIQRNFQGKRRVLESRTKSRRSTIVRACWWFIMCRAICKHGVRACGETNSRLSASKTSKLPIEMIRNPGAGESWAYCTLFSHRYKTQKHICRAKKNKN